ncbi:prostatic spermine-binding protein-like [Notamacropus eugenii]|uniref:prostatic spermine-binding protein-like n=1 Tax=Notamacropus eugenii TaxID=9315 RepID=UPI003B6840E1
MRSFLVLVLLGGIICTFHGVLSRKLSDTGTLFSTSQQKRGGIVRAIKLFFGSLGYLKSIQVKIGDEWSSKYGVPGGRESRIILYEGESIIRVSGHGSLCIHEVEVETTAGRIFEFGKPVGTYFDDSIPQFNMELSGIEGLYGYICIKKLKCKWSYIPVNTTDIPQTAEATVQTS